MEVGDGTVEMLVLVVVGLMVVLVAGVLDVTGVVDGGAPSQLNTDGPV